MSRIKITDPHFLEQLFQANSVVRFLTEKQIAISADVKRKTYQMYLNDINSKAWKTWHEIREKQLISFFNAAKDREFGRTYIWGNIFIAPPTDVMTADQLLCQVRGRDLRVKQTKLWVNTGSQLEKDLFALGAKLEAHQYVGLVCEGLEYLEKVVPKDDLMFKEMKSADVEDAMALEFLSHASSTSSLARHTPKSEFQGFFDFLAKNKHPVLLAMKKGHLVGIISPGINSLGNGHLMTISVHPDLQGQGIGKRLYLEALKFWQRRGVQVYTGYSASNEVVQLATKMKRQQTVTSLLFSR